MKGTKRIRSISGVRYRPGVHEIPDEYLDILPSSAKVVEGREEAEKVQRNVTLKDLDELRHGAKEVDKKVEAAEARRSNLEKARAAKAEKQEAE